MSSEARASSILPRLGARTLARLLLAGVAALFVTSPASAQPTTARVSVSSGGAEGNGYSFAGVVSADGRWVAFVSQATNLVAGDTNRWQDVFVHDRHTGTTTRVSLGPGGIEANGPSGSQSISADGRMVAFTSRASNLVSGDTNGASDVFVHDRHTGMTSRVSVFGGVSQGSRASGNAAISADGRFVAFDSFTSDFDDTNQASDVFVHDRVLATTTRVSVGPLGVEANAGSDAAAISADGRWVAFTSSASNLIVGDTNDAPDVFVHDRRTATTSRVSVGPGGTEGNRASGSAAISADGRYVAFDSLADNLIDRDSNQRMDVFVHNVQTGTTTRVSEGSGGVQGNHLSVDPALSADGRWVAFTSSASNLVVDDTNAHEDVFAHDRHTGTTTRVSVGPGGLQANSVSVAPSVSTDGRWIAFSSVADNLVTADTNAGSDVFVFDRGVASCAVTLTPSTAWAPAAPSTDRIFVLAAADCAWTAESSDRSWLSVTAGANGIGVGTVDYHVAANTAGPRSGAITIGGRTFTVTQVSATEPMPPEALTAHVVRGSVVTLRWTMPSFGPAPTHFVLEGGLSRGQTLATLSTGSSAPVVSVTMPTGSFYVRVRAANGAHSSAPSNEILLHVNVAVPPSAPRAVVGLVTGSTVTLAWTNTYEGGAPASLLLTIAGPTTGSVPLVLSDSVSARDVSPGTYVVSLSAVNGAGVSPPSNAVALTVTCSGPPFVPTGVVVYNAGRTVFVEWAPGPGGPAPTSYRLHVSGTWTGTIATTGRAMSRAAAPGSYTLSVQAVNACGVSGGTAPYTVVVP